MLYFLIGLARFGEFYGRTSRKAFWIYTLIHYILNIGVVILSNYLAVHFNNPQHLNLVYIFIIFFFLPNLSSSWRRIQDTGNPGYLLFVPFVNIYLLIKRGSDGENKYGPEAHFSEIW
jgi:uncharacterized membrane protein YhaH (DUF805 family)